MAVWSLGGSQPVTTGQWMVLIGAAGAVFSIILALLVLFVLPSTSVYFSGFILITLSATFLAGLLILLIGKVLEHKKARNS